MLFEARATYPCKHGYNPIYSHAINQNMAKAHKKTDQYKNLSKRDWPPCAPFGFALTKLYLSEEKVGGYKKIICMKC